MIKSQNIPNIEAWLNGQANVLLIEYSKVSFQMFNQWSFLLLSNWKYLFSKKNKTIFIFNINFIEQYIDQLLILKITSPFW